jgi:hypothetical protein
MAAPLLNLGIIYLTTSTFNGNFNGSVVPNMTKNVEHEVHFEIPLSLAPIPADVDRRELNEAKITAAARQAMNGAMLLKGPLEVSLSMSYAPGTSMRKGHVWRITNPERLGISPVHSPIAPRRRFCERRAGGAADNRENLRRETFDGGHEH